MMRRTSRAALVQVGVALLVVVPLSSHAADPLQGWVVKSPPELASNGVSCDSANPLLWEVDLVDGRARFRRRPLRELQAPELRSVEASPQFSIEPHQDHPRQQVRVNDGFLVGYHGGEWGGAIYWFSQDARRHRKLSDQPLRHFLSLGATVFALVDGATWDGGLVLRLQRERGQWTAMPFAPLPGAPRVYRHEAPDRILMLADGQVLRLDLTTALTVPLHRRDAGYTGARSIAADTDGVIYIGAVGVVIRLTPTPYGYIEDWMVHPDDAEACPCSEDDPFNAMCAQ